MSFVERVNATLQRKQEIEEENRSLKREIKHLTAECDELITENETLKAAMREENQRHQEEYIAVEEAYLQCQKDLFDESERLQALKSKLEGGVRVEVYRDRYGDLRAHQMKTSAGSEATLILDDGVKI